MDTLQAAATAGPPHTLPTRAGRVSRAGERSLLARQKAVASDGKSTWQATAAIARILVPAVTIVIVLLVYYVKSRELDLQRRDQRALGSVARQLAAPLEAARTAWAGWCLDPTIPIALPGLHVPSAPATDATSPPAAACPAVLSCAQGQHRPAALRYVHRQLKIGSGAYAWTIDPNEFLRGSKVALPAQMDGLLIAERSGEVVAHLGADYASIRTLKDFGRTVAAEPEKDAELDLPLKLGKIHQVTVGGEPHLLYAVRLPIDPAVGERTVEKGAARSQDLVVVALVCSQRASRDRLVLPYWWVVGLSFALVIAALSWPILKLLFMSPGERLKTIDVRVLVVTSVLSAAVISIAIVGTLTVWAVDDALDERLQTLADDLGQRLRTEVAVTTSAWSALRDAYRSAPWTPSPSPIRKNWMRGRRSSSIPTATRSSVGSPRPPHQRVRRARRSSSRRRAGSV
jgi:hypothetical protein